MAPDQGSPVDPGTVLIGFRPVDEWEQLPVVTEKILAEVAIEEADAQ